MANRKFSGNIGYGLSSETTPDVWVEQIQERRALGEVKSNSRGSDTADAVNPDFKVNVTISILADEFANGHIHAMKYVWWRGARWSISDVRPEPPRLLLRLGGLYNGPIPTGSV